LGSVSNSCSCCGMVELVVVVVDRVVELGKVVEDKVGMGFVVEGMVELVVVVVVDMVVVDKVVEDMVVVGMVELLVG